MKEINDFDEDKTLSLWEDDSQKMMILADMHSGEQFSFMLKKNCIAGRRRPPSDLQITTQDRYISGSHVCFEKKGNAVYIRDLNSKNGSWLNGQRIVSCVRVHQGDILKVGRSEFKIYLG
nr:FHA domain-containing protein [uncultured Blautia sp.]